MKLRGRAENQGTTRTASQSVESGWFGALRSKTARVGGRACACVRAWLERSRSFVFEAIFVELSPGANATEKSHRFADMHGEQSPVRRPFPGRSPATTTLTSNTAPTACANSMLTLTGSPRTPAKGGKARSTNTRGSRFPREQEIYSSGKGCGGDSLGRRRQGRGRSLFSFRAECGRCSFGTTRAANRRQPVLFRGFGGRFLRDRRPGYVKRVAGAHPELQVGHRIEPKAHEQPFPQRVVGDSCETGRENSGEFRVSCAERQPTKATSHVPKCSARRD